MRDNTPYPDNPGSTHYPGCYRDRGHHNCAVETAEALLEALAGLNGHVELMQLVMVEYLKPQGMPDSAFIATIVEMLDGPDQRQAQEAAAAALSTSRRTGA